MCVCVHVYVFVCLCVCMCMCVCVRVCTRRLSNEVSGGCVTEVAPAWGYLGGEDACV